MTIILYHIRMLIGLVIALVLILIMVFVHYDSRKKILNRYVSGFWKADSEFCKQSGIESMYLYIGDDADYKKAVLIIYNNDNIAAEKIIGINIGRISLYPLCSINAGIELEDLNPENGKLEDIMPECLSIKLNLKSGVLRIYDEDMVYFRGYKDYESAE